MGNDLLDIQMNPAAWEITRHSVLTRNSLDIFMTLAVRIEVCMFTFVRISNGLAVEWLQEA